VPDGVTVAGLAGSWLAILRVADRAPVTGGAIVSEPLAVAAGDVAQAAVGADQEVAWV
jgi:hypothetical protein